MFIVGADFLDEGLVVVHLVDDSLVVVHFVAWKVDTCDVAIEFFPVAQSEASDESEAGDSAD